MSSIISSISIIRIQQYGISAGLAGWPGCLAVGLAIGLAIGLYGYVLSHPSGAAAAARIAPPPMADCTVKERRPDRKARADFLRLIHRGPSTAVHLPRPIQSAR